MTTGMGGGNTDYDTSLMGFRLINLLVSTANEATSKLLI